MDRRQLLFGTTALVSGGFCLLSTKQPTQAAEPEVLSLPPVHLTAGAVRHQILPLPHAATPVWGYSYTAIVPSADSPSVGSLAPVLRAQRGRAFHLRLHNALPLPTSLHFHGVRVPIMSAEVAMGQSADITLIPPDAGTFLYRAGMAPHEQVERGLVGALIVEETTPVPIDQDVVVLLKDFALLPDGQMDERGGSQRLGNVLSVNGQAARLDLAVQKHQRLRLRLLNGCTKRIFPVRASGVNPYVMALDAQPCEPFQPNNQPLWLAPGNRADLFVDVTAAGGALDALLDGRVVPLVRFIMGEGAHRPALLPSPAPLPANSGSLQLDLANAHRVSLTVQASTSTPETWRFLQALDEQAAPPPLFRVAKGRTVVMQLENQTAQLHALHFEGHRVRPLDILDDGWKPWMLDTVLLFEKERQLIAFVAENVGRWRVLSSLLTPPEKGQHIWFEVV